MVPFSTKRDNCEINFLSFSNDSRISCALCAASAFGSMLRDDRRPIWKQRITHKALKSLEGTIHSFQENKGKLNLDNLGFVAVVGHLICDSNLKNMNQARKSELLKVLVISLCSGPPSFLINAPEIEQQLGETKRLVIAAILRLSLSSTGLVSLRESWCSFFLLCSHFLNLLTRQCYRSCLAIPKRLFWVCCVPTPPLMFWQILAVSYSSCKY